jgi:hypothetical protein
MGSSGYSHTVESFDFSSTPPRSVGNYTFYFKNAANLATFAADPWKYAPRWGGF